MEKLIEGLKNPNHCTYSVSITVLMRDPLVKDVPDLLASYQTDLLKAVLFKYGFDLDKGIVYEECEHRNCYGERVNGALFKGKERVDERWKSLKRHRLTKKASLALINSVTN
ncbi:hypothetical protein Erwinia_phage_Rouille_00081 [Erwinia phage Rouille]|jgi:hypothetical protein|uniref:Gp071 n=1 Tax=Erwinia phage vB_Eam-MM7 TaxID=1051674 RepID=G0YPQ3_9CAUD|nr:gp071 [Erwinia phage vB_Eam-MM7]UNA01045.1 hypothetical protein 1Hena2_00095 [Erwinia phage Hena2]WJN64837.1 hypothetical protein Erwinia_phage_Rouille_00081 [Erwinia phage Rouille]WLW39304.1 hypothetical protein [Erwinia phage vB_EamM-BoyaciRG1]WNA13664.1 hypothetical protein FIfi106_00017 [Erwinia phage FIfi106]AEJ81330.1 gp071 [Erwinia phage vB_Eam-MM7]